MAEENDYPAKFDIKYPAKLDRFSTLFRPLFLIPAFIILMFISGGGSGDFSNEANNDAMTGGGGITAGLLAATALTILFRQRYPRWWFDFNLELNRFSSRVLAYAFLLTDQYPSTEDKQAVRFDVLYPDVKKDLNRWLPLIKWLLALPHYLVLAVLSIGVLFSTVIAWFAILITGRYPQQLFDYVVGVGRWSTRVTAYAFLLTTDEYPPFSLK